MHAIFHATGSSDCFIITFLSVALSKQMKTQEEWKFQMSNPKIMRNVQGKYVYTMWIFMGILFH